MSVSTRGAKRKLDQSVGGQELLSKSSKVFLLSSSLLLLEIPAEVNRSLPVWEAVKTQQLNIAWTINPYSVSVHLTPLTSNKDKTTASSKCQSPSSLPQTVAPSSSVQQTQMVIQSVPQQQAASQSSPCVLITFLQNSTQSSPQPQQTPPNPSQAGSLFVSLPLIITHPQPAAQPVTPTKNWVLPAIQTPTKLQAPAKAPGPSLFHTKGSSDIQICDDFLLSLCRAGRKCKMHHTPYPFHWQLWCVKSHQWIDIPPHSQVLLERIYCNVHHEVVSLKDGNVRNSLNFESMELEDQSKYDQVRRLTNSDSQLRNPYFPSQWKIYWWNSFSWEEYHKTLSNLLLRKMSEKEPDCFFYIGLQKYALDFTTMTQTNVTTGFQREVRCRPVYRSPDSLQPYLRTESDPPESATDPPANFNVDPLEEFSSWYPPVWCLVSGQDYSLVDVPAGSMAYQRVQNLFYEGLSETTVDIISIHQVQNVLHWDKYQRHKAHMQKQHTRSKEPLEKHLFHGTTKEASEDICHNNFDPRMAGVNGASYGFGSYFGTRASLSHAYSAMVGSGKVCHMFLAKVLVGKVSLGKSHYRRPPVLNSKMRQYRLYDACVDNVDQPTMFIVFDSCQCYPYYLIKYKDLPREIEI